MVAIWLLSAGAVQADTRRDFGGQTIDHVHVGDPAVVQDNTTGFDSQTEGFLGNKNEETLNNYWDIAKDSQGDGVKANPRDGSIWRNQAKADSVPARLATGQDDRYGHVHGGRQVRFWEDDPDAETPDYLQLGEDGRDVVRDTANNVNKKVRKKAKKWFR